MGGRLSSRLSTLPGCKSPITILTGKGIGALQGLTSTSENTAEDRGKFHFSFVTKPVQILPFHILPIGQFQTICFLVMFVFVIF